MLHWDSRAVKGAELRDSRSDCLDPNIFPDLFEVTPITLPRALLLWRPRARGSQPMTPITFPRALLSWRPRARGS